MGRAIRTRGCDPVLPALLQPLNGPFPREQARLLRRELIARYRRTRCLGYFGCEAWVPTGLGAHLCVRLFALHVTLHGVLGQPSARRALEGQAGATRITPVRSCRAALTSRCLNNQPLISLSSLIHGLSHNTPAPMSTTRQAATVNANIATRSYRVPSTALRSIHEDLRRHARRCDAGSPWGLPMQTQHREGTHRPMTTDSSRRTPGNRSAQ